MCDNAEPELRFQVVDEVAVVVVAVRVDDTLLGRILAENLGKERGHLRQSFRFVFEAHVATGLEKERASLKGEFAIYCEAYRVVAVDTKVPHEGREIQN